MGKQEITDKEGASIDEVFPGLTAEVYGPAPEVEPRERARAAQAFIHRIKVEKVRVTIPAFCPTCGQDLRGTGPNEIHGADGTFPLLAWITTMGTQDARVTRGERVGVVEASPGTFEPGDSTVFTTGYDCAACSSTIVSAGGFCSAGGPDMRDIDEVTP